MFPLAEAAVAFSKCYCLNVAFVAFKYYTTLNGFNAQRVFTVTNQNVGKSATPRHIVVGGMTKINRLHFLCIEQLS